MVTYQSKRAELWCALTHSLGIIGGIVISLFFYLHYDRLENKVLNGLSVYCFTLLFLYVASTIYHSVTSVNSKKIWQKFDHIGIYFLIAGTYTPICINLLWDSNGKLLLALIWSIALIGSGLKIKYTGRFEKLSLFLYLAMGWLILIDISHFLANASFKTILYLGLGGVAYSIGTVFYRWHKLPFHHVIWHIFVLIGSFFHLLMVEQSLKAVA